MRRLPATFATTHVDRQGEIISRGALQGMADAILSEYVPISFMHDPRIPPIGRIASAGLVERPGGAWAVEGELECWDPEDPPEVLRGDGRTVSLPDEPIARFAIGFDRVVEEELGSTYLYELAGLAGDGARPKYMAKKGMDVPTSIVIGLGLLALGQISSGFLNKLGEDIYEQLKRALKRGLSRTKERDHLIVLEVVANSQTGKVGLVLVATNPTPADIDALLTAGLSGLDKLAQRVLRDGADTARIVAELKGEGVRLLYTMRSDGVPTPRHHMTDNELRELGLSVSGHAESSSAGVDDKVV